MSHLSSIDIITLESPYSTTSTLGSAVHCLPLRADNTMSHFCRAPGNAYIHHRLVFYTKCYTVQECGVSSCLRWNPVEIYFGRCVLESCSREAFCTGHKQASIIISLTAQMNKLSLASQNVILAKLDCPIALFSYYFHELSSSTSISSSQSWKIQVTWKDHFPARNIITYFELNFIPRITFVNAVSHCFPTDRLNATSNSNPENYFKLPS